MYQRTLSRHLDRLTKNFPVVLVTGPRQVGKSTLLENYVSDRCNRVTLDDLNERAKAINDPLLFLQEHQAPLLIDEVQYAPELFSYIKIYVDQNRDKKGLFLLTGSQKFHLMKGVQETLAGRVAILDLLGLSNQEISNHPSAVPFLPTDDFIDELKKQDNSESTLQNIYTNIFNGSFPELVSRNGEDRDIYYSSYIRTYIDRDVRDSHDVSNTILFNNFIRAVAARTGQLLNISDIARDISIDNKTTQSWMNILEASGLVYLLHPYYNNITNRIIKTPKVYFLDTGLCAYLTGWDSPKSLERGAMSGAILESYVFSEILKSYWHNAKEPNIYFYRDRDAKEIDFIIEANNTIYPIKVKKTMMPDLGTCKNFSVLKKLQKTVAKGVVLCLKPEVSFISREIISIPITLV